MENDNVYIPASHEKEISAILAREQEKDEVQFWITKDKFCMHNTRHGTQEGDLQRCWVLEHSDTGTGFGGIKLKGSISIYI